jgi:transcriptional regulator
MGWAQERAAKIQETETARVSAITSHAENRAIVANNARALWDSLAGYLETMTKEFANSLPAAKSGNLRADKFNANNLTIQTNV